MLCDMDIHLHSSFQIFQKFLGHNRNVMNFTEKRKKNGQKMVKKLEQKEYKLRMRLRKRERQREKQRLI